MYIKDKVAFNAIVREFRKALSKNGAEVKYNTSHQIFARAHGHKTQASLLSSLPISISLNKQKAKLEEQQVDKKYQVKSDLVNILKNIGEDADEYNYLLVRIDLLQTVVQGPSDAIYEDEQPVRPMLNWLQECIGDEYKISGGLSLALQDEQFECNSYVFKGLNSQFNEAVEAKSIISVTAGGRYNPFMNGDDSEDDGWYPDIDVLSQILLLKIETSKALSQGSMLLPESILAQLRKENLEQWENQGDVFSEYSEVFAGELNVKPLGNINIYDFSQDAEEEHYFDSEEEFQIHLRRAPLTHLSSEEEFEEAGIQEDSYDSEFNKLLFLDDEEEYCTQRSHLWALNMLKSRDKSGLFIPDIDILICNNSCGGIYFSNNVAKIVVPHYDQFGSGSPELATCVHYGKMKDIKKIFPNALYYCVQNFTWEEIECPEDSEYCAPAILNHFGEAYRNWPSDVSKAQSKDKFAFEIHGPDLINKYGIKCVCVDDFQESYGGMTGVLLASFYDESENLVAELSYCVLLQNDMQHKEERCIELIFDERLKSFCKENDIEVLWSEHSTNHPYGKRKYNQSENNEGLIASNPKKYLIDSTLLMGVRFPMMQCINSKNLNHTASSFFEWCITGIDGQRTHFDFYTIPKSDENIGDYQSVIKDVVSAQSETLELSIFGSYFIGGFNLKGMAFNERYNSIRNTLIRKTDTDIMKNGCWFKLHDEIAREWCNKLKIPDTPIEVSFFKDPFKQDKLLERYYSGCSI